MICTPRFENMHFCQICFTRQMPELSLMSWLYAEVPVPNVLDDLPTESLSSISKRLVPTEVKEAVQEAPAVAKDVAEQAADALPQ